MLVIAASGRANFTLATKPQRPQKRMASNNGLPKLVAFDLDGTMWYPEMYMLDGGAPFHRDPASGSVFDSAGERIKLLGETLQIITTITTDPLWEDCQIAYVSRTEYPEWAIPCLKQFPIPNHPRGLTLFDVSSHNEIYPGSKLTHFKAIHKRTGIDFADMLFFDNERWNCTEVARLGVKCVYTPRGMTAAAWKEGLASFEGGSSAAGGVVGQKQKQKKKAPANPGAY